MSRPPDAARPFSGGLRSAIGLIAFPTTAAALSGFYHGTLSFRGDPRLWSLDQWALLLGPLVGFGFLAGATLDLPDPDGPRRRLGRLLGRRALWVAVGPWLGFLIAFGLLYGGAWALDRLAEALDFPPPGGLLGTHPAIGYGLFGLCAAGWLVPALAALRRARRLGRLRRALGRGLATAAAFVGSLVGTFWAATEALRPYFFDPRLVQSLLLAGTALALSGCAGPETLGDVRRRELFQALLLAWVVGLALIWRRASRPR